MLGYLVFVVKEISEHRPTRALNRVFLLEEGEFLSYLSDRVVALVYGVPREEREQPLFYISDLVIGKVIDMKLLAKAEYLALNVVSLVTACVVYKKFVSPRKELLLLIKHIKTKKSKLVQHMLQEQQVLVNTKWI